MNKNTSNVISLFEEVQDHFKEVDVELFKKEFNEWADKSSIVKYRINPTKNNVVVILKSNDPMSSTMSPKDVYTIVRLFPGGDRWHVSVDISDVSPDELISELLIYNK